MSKTTLKSVLAQCSAILITAVIAALISFFSSLASGLTSCGVPITDPAEVGFLGGMLKTAHAFLFKHHA